MWTVIRAKKDPARIMAALKAKRARAKAAKLRKAAKSRKAARAIKAGGRP